LNDFGAVITNPNVLYQFTHVVAGGIVTGAFFVIAISAYRLLRTKDADEQFMFGRSMRLGLVMGLASIVFSITIGHYSGQFMLDKQPMKLAASEGLWESASPASLSFFQIGDEVNRTSIINIEIPSLLSFLVYDEFEGLVPGMNDLNEIYQVQYADQYGPDADYIPPMVWLIYWSFRAMVGFGFLMAFIVLVGLFLWWRGRLDKTRWFLYMLPFLIILPYVANATGWMVTEVGRQPWIVHGLMRIEDAVSPNLTAFDLAITLVGFVLVYGLLTVADFYLLWRYGSGGASDTEVLPLPQSGSESDMDLSLKQSY